MTHPTASRFPAILIGGPPHTGKSVLSRCLSQALVENGLQHYLLRAAPDGEGNWFHEADPSVARSLRRKGSFTPTWIERMCHDLAARPLPFLVDIGGRPEPWQEAIIDHCTHAILLTTGDDSLAEWQERVARYNLLVIASLTSQRTGGSYLAETTGPVIRGTITQLERGQQTGGPVFEAVLGRVKALFNYSYEELLHIHHEQAPVELVVDLPAMYRQLNPTRPGYDWQPADLPRVFDYLPQDTPLALYGRGPAWLYAAVANSIFLQPFYQFDVRYGWVKPVTFNTDSTHQPPITLTVKQAEPYLHLKIDLPEDYLVYEPELNLSLPTLPPPVSPSSMPGNTTGLSWGGVVLDGKLPNWLYTGLTLYYRSAPWIAIYYPHRDQAVIVASSAAAAAPTMGQSLSLAASDYANPGH